MRIAIGAITRQRPQMFADLLASFEKMQRPEGVELVFLFAENDQALSMGPQVEAFGARIGLPVVLELETRPGIPMARNKVLDMALANGADFLTFVDDDEQVEPGWLTNLYRTINDRSLDLVGGPVVYVPPPGAMTRMNAAVMDYLQERSAKQIAQRAKMAQNATDGGMNIYTNNWICRLATARDLGIRFNEDLQYTGGSDTRFSLDMKAAGGRIGWAPEARVIEPTPQKRLRLGYQFGRARDQALNAIVLGGKPPAKAIKEIIVRCIDGTVLIVLSPVLGAKSFVKGIYKYGKVVGNFKALVGGKSQHYAPGSEKFHAEKQD